MRRIATVWIILLSVAPAAVAVGQGSLIGPAAWDGDGTPIAADAIVVSGSQVAPNGGVVSSDSIQAYASLRFAQNPQQPQAELTVPPGETLPAVESVEVPGGEVVGPMWPEYEVGPQWWKMAAARNGTNPAANIRNWSLRTSYVDLRNVEASVAELQLRWPILAGRGGLKVDVPYVYVNPDWADGQGGFADLRFELNYNFQIDEAGKWTIFPLLELYVPTKVEDWIDTDFTSLRAGFRRWVLGPGVGLLYTPNSNSFAAWLYYHEFDVAGNSGDDVSFSRLKMLYMYQWDSGWYVMPELRFNRDREHGGRGQALMAEFGYTFERATLFSAAGWGLDSDWDVQERAIFLGLRVNY